MRLEHAGKVLAALEEQKRAGSQDPRLEGWLQEQRREVARHQADAAH